MTSPNHTQIADFLCSLSNSDEARESSPAAGPGSDRANLQGTQWPCLQHQSSTWWCRHLAPPDPSKLCLQTAPSTRQQSAVRRPTFAGKTFVLLESSSCPTRARQRKTKQSCTYDSLTERLTAQNRIDRPAPQSALSLHSTFGGSHNSTLLLSGSQIQANRP